MKRFLGFGVLVLVGCGGSTVSTTPLTGSVTFSAPSVAPTAFGGSSLAFSSPAVSSAAGNVYRADDITRKVTITFPTGNLYQNMVFPALATDARLDYFDPNGFTYTSTSGRITLNSATGYTLTNVRVDDGNGRAVTLNGGFSGFSSFFGIPGGVNGTLQVPGIENFTTADGPTVVGANNRFRFGQAALPSNPSVEVLIPTSISLPTSGNVLSIASGSATIKFTPASGPAVSGSSGYLSIYNNGTGYVLSVLNFGPAPFNGVLIR